MSGIVNKFWITVTAVLTVLIWLWLFPTMLDRYGLLRTIGVSIVLVVAMSLHYIRVYWISTWFGKDAHEKQSDKPSEVDQERTDMRQLANALNREITIE